jgi:cytochrome c-type biogenesis protein CcmH/NrfG
VAPLCRSWEALLGRSSTDGALVGLDIARRKGFLNSSSYSLLGSIYINKEMPETAADAYGNALTMGRPPFADVIDAFNYLSRFGEVQLTGDYLDKVISTYTGRLNPNDRRSLEILQARVLMDSGQTADGAGLLREVIQADPTNGDALLSLANYYRQQQDFERADIFFQRAESEEEVALEALTAHAQMATDREDWQSGIALLRQAGQHAMPDSLLIIEENIKALERLLTLLE